MKVLRNLTALIILMYMFTSCSFVYDDFKDTSDSSGVTLTPDYVAEISRELASSSAAAASSKEAAKTTSPKPDTAKVTTTPDTATAPETTTAPKTTAPETTKTPDTAVTTPEVTTKHSEVTTTEYDRDNTVAPPQGETTVPTPSETTTPTIPAETTTGSTTTARETLEPDIFTTIPNGATVYWTNSGSVWHVSRGCSALKNSTDIISGTQSDAVAAGKSRVCKKCG